MPRLPSSLRSLLVVALATLGACSRESTAPVAGESLDGISVDLVQQYEASSAAAVDRAGIGGSEFPDSLKLSAEQKAKIQALHEAYQKANAADLAALKKIEDEARAAIAAKKSRAEVNAILAKGQPILQRLAAAFAKLQRDIWAVYTPAQQAWITARMRGAMACSPSVLNQLSAEQSQKIRALRAAFAESVKGDMATLQKIHEEARAAAQRGASREEVGRILAKAEPVLQAIAAAERKLAASILEVLTPAQRQNSCLVRLLTGR